MCLRPPCDGHFLTIITENLFVNYRQFLIKKLMVILV